MQEKPSSHPRIMNGLIVVAFLLAVAAKMSGLTDWLEAISFATGGVWVWLTIRENIWSFPIGLINVLAYSIVFFQAELFADASLQLIYFLMTSIGWYMWLHGGTHRSKLAISSAHPRELSIVALLTIAMTLFLWHTLSLVGGSASFWDALTTAISLGAQWLLNRKRLENWLVWILVDAIYVPLYCYKGLYLTAVLYAVFLAMAVLGFLQWRRQLHAESLERSPLEQVRQ